MKTALLILTASLLFGCGSRVAETPQAKAQADASVAPFTPTFDSVLAAKVGADPYGMKAFILVYLLPGNPAATDSMTPEQNMGVQKAHLNHLFTQSREGKMVLAGPMMRMAHPDSTQNSNSTLRSVEGICVYDCPYEEAKTRANADPAVLAGQLVVECYPWYGSAAMTIIPEMSEKITKKSIMDEF